jgi:heptosyltransferase-3
MKILILELARLGDIFQTWPALRGLRRLYPEAQIEVLSRGRYEAALQGLEVINKIRLLPTRDLMEPLVEPQMDVKQAHARISAFVAELKSEKFDWILNFTFSPFSSYLTHAISHPHTKVSGYTRTSDGFLSIPDDMSAYFYAQAGVQRPNRFHLADIFATLAGVDLTDEDWRPPQGLSKAADAPEVLLHVGASENKKQISPVKWATIINQLKKLNPVHIGLIGAANETSIADQIMSSIPAENVTNYVGRTQLSDVFSLIAGARLVVGADSAPMHMASLTGTPCVNLSLSTVNFWETGPRAAGSIVLRGQDETDLASDKVAQAIQRALTGGKQDLSVIQVQKGSPSYWALQPKEAEFQWNLLRAIYMGEDFPATDNSMFRDGIAKLSDINTLMIEQMEQLQKGTEISKVAGIIDRGEEIIDTVGKLVPSLSPLIRWYQTEKVRIGPDEQAKLLEKSLHIQNLLQKVLDLYLESFGSSGTNPGADVLSEEAEK